MKIIIAGAYAIGNYLASLLARSNEEITIIDTDEEALESINLTLTCSLCRLRLFLSRRCVR